MAQKSTLKSDPECTWTCSELRPPQNKDHYCLDHGWLVLNVESHSTPVHRQCNTVNLHCLCTVTQPGPRVCERIQPGRMLQSSSRNEDVIKETKGYWKHISGQICREWLLSHVLLVPGLNITAISQCTDTCYSNLVYLYSLVHTDSLRVYSISNGNCYVILHVLEPISSSCL